MRLADIPLSRAKTTIPVRRPEIVSRARLLARLDELLDKQLILVTAPAGYGKTSLLVDLANTTGMPVCWLSLDVLDQEPQRFLAYFIASISQRFPQFGNQSNAALKEIVAPDGSLENLVITIVNEIDEHIREHFMLILDDYQFVDGIAEIRNFIGRFVELFGENCHLILASRRLPALPDLPVLVARQQVGGFDLIELAFRPDEIHLLFEQGYGVSISEEDVDELARRTEGWVTGLLLAQHANVNGMPDLTRAARSVGVDLSDYFDQQVLGQQSLEVRSFLLQTSLLEEFDAVLCDSVLGVGDWRAIMNTIRRSNLFTLSVGSRGEWMRYHALFREFLQERIRQESPETAQAILVRLAEVSEEHGDWEKAHYALAQAGDQNALAALLERAGTLLVEYGRFLTLSAWLDELSATHVQQSPSLLLLGGIVSLVKGQVQFGLALIDRAEALFRAASDQPNTAVALVRRSWAQRLLGGYEQAVMDADEAIRLMAWNPAQGQIQAEAYRMKGLALFRQGKVQESEECLGQALQMFYDLQREKNIPLAQMELGMARRAQGDTSSAQVYYEKALASWQEQGNLTSQATVLNSLGVLQHARGEYEKAIHTFDKGLDCARRSGYIRSQALILVSQGDVYTDVSDPEMADQIYQQSYDIAIQIADHFLTNYTRISQAGVFRLKGDYEQARLLLDHTKTAIQEIGSHYESGLYGLESGRLSLASGYPRAAIMDLQAALENFEQGGLLIEAAWARLWLAAALADAGEVKPAGKMMEAILGSADGGELMPSVLSAGLQARTWLAALVEADKVGPRVRLFLEKVESFQKQLPSLRRRLRRLNSVVPVAVSELVVRAFGKPQVMVRGRAVTNAQWHSRTVKELFFLFVHATEPMTKEQIGEVLWPDSEPEQLKLRFKNELYRLRRAVGQDVVVFDGSTYRFNRDLDYDCDVENFERSLRSASTSQSAEEKLRAYQDAVTLFRGPYLENIDSTWVFNDRERLRQKYLDTLLALAVLLLDRKETDEALKVCHYALAADKAFEEAHRLMMRIHAARGDRMGVTHQYQACRIALADELGIPVSMETELLYRQLTS